MGKHNQGHVTVVGSGAVGISTAARLAAHHHVAVIDVVPGLAEGSALDLKHAAAVERRDPSAIVGSNDFGVMDGSRVVVVAAGSARRPNISRDDLLAVNREIVAGIAREVRRHSPDAVVVMLTNPVEPLCEEVLRVTGVGQRIVGLSGVLDSARFTFALAEATGTSPKQIDAMVIGRHGDSMVPLVSRATVGGAPVTGVLSAAQIRAVVQRTKFSSTEVLDLLPRGATYWAPSAATALMVEAILHDSRELVPCTALCSGQYGLYGFLGVPIRLGAGGVEEIVELELSATELAALRRSATEVARLVGPV